jgi:hypothetical protein
MSARLTIYCTRAVDHITAVDLKAAIDEADLHTNAEVWGIEDEAVVDDALSNLVIEAVSEPGRARFRLRYATAERRPILIHVSSRSSADEMLDELRDVRTKAFERVRQVLSETVQEVNVELGWQQLEDMGIVLASRIAETLAFAGRGLIRDQNDEWWAVEGGVPRLVLGRRGDA